MQKWSRVGGALLLVACGGSPSTAPQAPKSETSQVAPAPRARTVPQDLRKYWAFDDADFKLYADVRGLLRTELMAGLVPAALGNLGAELSPQQRSCVNALFAHAREVAVADQWLAVGFDPQGMQALRDACLSQLPRVAGTTEAYTLEQRSLLVDSNVALLGPAPLVERSLDAKRAPEAWPAALELKPERYLAWTAEVRRVESGRYAFTPELAGTKASGGLELTPRAFALNAQATLPKTEQAEQAVALVEAGRARLPKPSSGPQAEILGKVSNALTLRREGSTLYASFRLEGSPAEQAEALGATVALAVFGVQRYIRQAKNAEARGFVEQIAQSYIMSFSAPHAGRKPPKLFSLPPVPSKVPSGTKYQSSDGDWLAWKRIGVSLHEPQYYQYEVVAAKDGRSADVVARGDLDADGQLSEFRLKIVLDEKQGTLSTTPELEEMHPEE
jgi:hypothetical protein